MEFQITYRLPLNITNSLQLLHKNNRSLEQFFIPKNQKPIIQAEIKVQSKEVAIQTIDGPQNIELPKLFFNPLVDQIIQDQVTRKQVLLQQVTEQFDHARIQVEIMNQKKGRILQLRTILEHRLQQKYSKQAVQCEKYAQQIQKQEKEISRLNKQNSKLRLICEQFQSL